MNMLDNSNSLVGPWVDRLDLSPTALHGLGTDGLLIENSVSDETTLLEAVCQAQKPPCLNAATGASCSNDTPDSIWPFQLERNGLQSAATPVQVHTSHSVLGLISNDAESTKLACPLATPAKATNYEAAEVADDTQPPECFSDNIDPQAIFNPSTIAHITQNMMTAMGLPYLGDLTPSFTNSQPLSDERTNSEFVTGTVSALSGHTCYALKGSM
ncbi:hypothetical protein H4R35_006340 [Dimargaris xerosporica]|nr:hypothetical protein H4R35_006340 [Dimargaris xerosporica]